MSLMEREQSNDSGHRVEPFSDWTRFQRLYGFCRARAIERIILVDKGDVAGWTKGRRDLRVLESMYTKARQQQGIVIGCAVTYFRAQAMRDAQHPDFLGEWI
jgi:hypothetical protein